MPIIGFDEPEDPIIEQGRCMDCTECLKPDKDEGYEGIGYCPHIEEFVFSWLDSEQTECERFRR